MTEEIDLKVGSFYWVIPGLNPDTDEEWKNSEQPARFAGRNEHGQLLWNYLGYDGISDWDTIWIGDEITHIP